MNNKRFRTAVFIVFVLFIPLVVTFYTWQLTKKSIEEAAYAKFETLVKESEKALLYRITSYKQALLGGKGFYQGSTHVSREEWRAYVQANDVLKNFPGINGIGTVYDVPEEGIQEFEETARKDGAPQFNVHPKGEHQKYFVIKYIEPERINLEAIGLNIGFEEHRRAAADRARDTGQAAITKRILLVQDTEKTPGFLLLLPVYKKGMPISSIPERRAAFSHWIYAPFVGKNFMHGLTQSQGETLHLEVYDEGTQTADTLIFDSNRALDTTFAPRFKVEKVIEVMQQKWRLVWSSTPEFEQIEESNEATLILVAGLLFTGLLAVFVIVMAIRADDDLQVTYKSYTVPLAAFIITVFAGYLLRAEIITKERSFIENVTYEASQSIANTINGGISSRLLALGRMAERWNVRDGTPFNEWQRDAEFYVKDQPGLKAVEWVDATYHVRWVEPEKENEKVKGLYILFDGQRAEALKDAAEKGMPTVTNPLDLVQGYRAFISYFPLYKKEVFDGFIVGVFGVQDLLEASLSGISLQDFSVELTHKGKVFYSSVEEENQTQYKSWVATRVIDVLDKRWFIKVYPKPFFVRNHTSFLPDLVLVVACVLALMVALIIYSAQLSRVKTQRLLEQENLLSTFIKYTPAAVAMLDKYLCYIAASERWYKDYGITEKSIIGKNHYEVFPEILNNHPEWLVTYQKVINGEIVKIDEEKFIRSDGRVEWLRYELRPWSQGHGEKSGLIMFTENITERKQMETMKDEFISTVNHELRTPLTSIQTSLGLLRTDARLEKEDKRILELAYGNCERLTRLINDILDIEKIAAGKMDYVFEEIEMNALVQEVIEQHQSYASKYKVGFLFESSIKNVYCRLDENRFAQALANLLSNAAKFSPEGESILVRLKLETKNKLRLSVIDNGQGIPEDFKKKIFTKFAQADSSATRTKGGTGLGLNITKSIIEAFGGKVTFDSITGKGSAFHFILPVVSKKYVKKMIEVAEDA